MAKRHDSKPTDVQEGRAHSCVEDKNKNYGFDILNIYFPPTAPRGRGGWYDGSGGHDGLCVCADANWAPTTTIVAETWPEFMEVPTKDHAGWKGRHGQRSWAIAAIRPFAMRDCAT